MMVTLWKQVRERAAEFVHTWREASYESGDSQSFYNDFFNVFGVRRRTVARFEEHVKKLDNRDGFIDLFWPGVLLVEQKSAGQNLTRAYDQAAEYFDALPELDRPRYILVSDFHTFELRDLDERRIIAFEVDDLPKHVKEFRFILDLHRLNSRGRRPSSAPDDGLPRQWEHTVPGESDWVEEMRTRFGAASTEVMNWPRTLPDGKTIARPELGELEARIDGSRGSTTAVLGDPGSGKSALLSTLTHRYAERGWPVLAIKGDTLDAEISSEVDLQEHLGLDARPSELLEDLAESQLVLLVLDQLDALAGYIDLRTARLNILLNLVRRLGRTDNVHIVLSSRTFEFEHDSRLKTVAADAVSLELPPWSVVLELLQAHRVHAAGWPKDAQEVIRAPQALTTYLKLKSRHVSEEFTSYQTMLDRLWKERVLEHDGGGRRSRLATDIADRMADEESLWLASARFDVQVQDIDALESAGVLTRLDSRVGFTHQTLFDYALARNFAGEPRRLSSYVLGRQDSLFLRPKLWAALNYLREAEPTAYHRELEEIWRAPRMRRHLRFLLIEFIGQQAHPTNQEAVLMAEALRLPNENGRAYRAMIGSPGWFERLSKTSVAEGMSEEDETADLMIGVLERAWSFSPVEVQRLLGERWAPHPHHDTRTWWVLQNAPRWTDDALATACSIVERTDIGEFQIDHVLGTIGVEQPEAALQLLRARLDKELETAEARSAALAKEERPQFDNDEEEADRIAEEVAWITEKHPRIPLKELIDDKNGWDTVPTLAEQAPASFLRILWPWFERCLEALRERSEHDAGELQYPLVHDTDFLFEEEQDTGLREPALLAALRTAAERVARMEPDEWLSWVATLSTTEVMPAQRLIAHSFTMAPDRFAQQALKFLLEDNRRFVLGSMQEMTGTSSRLVKAVNGYWSDEELDLFEKSIKEYNPLPPGELIEVERRRSWRRVVRRIKLPLLRALPKNRLNAKSRRHIDEEERVFPDSHLGARLIGPSVTGSIMTAAAMARASDEHILKAFRSLPDETLWDHPERFMFGGNVQLSREFANFSKESPERVIRVLSLLSPDIGTRAAGYALEAMSEETAPDQVLKLLQDVVARGFDSEEFRGSASKAVAKLSDRGVRIGDDTVATFEKWLAHPLVKGSGDDETGPEAEVDAATECCSEGDREDDDCTRRSVLWGHGSISRSPGGDYPVLEALIRMRLAREEHDRVDETLSSYLDSCKDPQVWDHVLRLLPHPKQGRESRRAGFLERLFVEVPRLVESKTAAYVIMKFHHWSGEVANAQLDRLRDSKLASGRQTYGEIVARTSLLQPSLKWASTRLEEVTGNLAFREARAGAALSAAHLWRHPNVAPRAARLLVELLAGDDSDVWKAVSEIFRLSGELNPDPPTISLLEAIAEKPGPALRRKANFVATRLATLLPHAAKLVGRVAESLISDWRMEIGDKRTTTAMAAQELVDLAVTLHRLGPETREVGTKLFEDLLEIDALEARQTLEEIDHRFREKAIRRRPRIAPHRRRRVSAGADNRAR